MVVFWSSYGNIHPNKMTAKMTAKHTPSLTIDLSYMWSIQTYGGLLVIIWKHTPKHTPKHTLFHK